MNRIETHQKAIAILEAIETQKKKIESINESLIMTKGYFPMLDTRKKKDIYFIERSIVRLTKKYERLIQQLCK